MALYTKKEQIVPIVKTEPEEEYQPFTSNEEQLAPGEEVYDIKQEFLGNFTDEIEASTCECDSDADESTVYNSSSECLSPGEETYDIKKEFEGTCYAATLPVIKSEPMSDESEVEDQSTLDAAAIEDELNDTICSHTSSSQDLPLSTSSPKKPGAFSSESSLRSPPSSPVKTDLSLPSIPIPSIPVLPVPIKGRKEENETRGTQKYTELLRRRVEVKLFEKMDMNLLSALPLSPRTKKDIKKLQSTLRFCHRLQMYSDVNAVEEKYMEDLTDSQKRLYRKRKAETLEKMEIKRMKNALC